VEVTFMGSLRLLALVFFGRDLGRRLLEKAKDFEVTLIHHDVRQTTIKVITPLVLCPNIEIIAIVDDGTVGAFCD